MPKIVKPQKLSIREHPEITEKFIQNMIAEDPSMIGLGELILKDKERMQPRAGRLDLLLVDPEDSRRYEIEIQLGKTDESHIIRTIEYWDIERKRYPQYDHCAVIIAEDITSRFLNVINLFNGFIPLVAIQMNAYKHDDNIMLIFTKVLSEMQLGLIDDDDAESIETHTNRDYWNKRAPETMKIADQLLQLLNQMEPGAELEYNRVSISITRNKILVPYLLVRPRKKEYIVLVLKVARSQTIDNFLGENDLNNMEYNSRLSRYRVRISSEDVTHKPEAIKALVALVLAEAS
jgi:hypothetical protein